jgi:hypothetical protein
MVCVAWKLKLGWRYRVVLVVFAQPAYTTTQKSKEQFGTEEQRRRKNLQCILFEISERLLTSTGLESRDNVKMIHHRIGRSQ